MACNEKALAELAQRIKDGKIRFSDMPVLKLGPIPVSAERPPDRITWKIKRPIWKRFMNLLRRLFRRKETIVVQAVDWGFEPAFSYTPPHTEDR